jgi:hypothetical protein
MAAEFLSFVSPWRLSSMSKLIAASLAATLLTLLPSVTRAQENSAASDAHTLALEPGTASPPATINDVAWIAGDWTCEALGGVAEEYWQVPAGGAMLGSFRLLRGGEPSFYKIATLSELNDSLVLRTLHFDAALRGWENEKTGPQRFPLVKIEGKKAYFNGITFEKKDDGSLDVWVVVNKDGSNKEVLFPYKPMTAGSKR